MTGVLRIVVCRARARGGILLARSIGSILNWGSLVVNNIIIRNP